MALLQALLTLISRSAGKILNAIFGWAVRALFGIPAQSALALSLIKRAADLAVGGPGLIAWQVLEASRIGKRKAPATK